MPTCVLQLGDAQTVSNPRSPAAKAQLRLTNQGLWELKSQAEVKVWSVRDDMNHGALLSHESEQNRIICSNGLKRKTLGWVKWNKKANSTCSHIHAKVNVYLIELKSKCQNLWTVWWMERWGDKRGTEIKLGGRNNFQCSVAHSEYCFSVAD